MNLKQLAEQLDLRVVACSQKLERTPTGGYTSDLLSDVIANSGEGNLWVTLQTHQNIVAVAVLRSLCGIIIVGGREASQATIDKANQSKIPLMTTPLNAYEVSGRLYQAGIKSATK